MAKPIISEAKCAESVKMAIELAQIPPMTWTTMKIRETKEAIRSFFIALELDLSKLSFLALKLIGVLTGIGVPLASGISLLNILIQMVRFYLFK